MKWWAFAIASHNPYHIIDSLGIGSSPTSTYYQYIALCCMLQFMSGVATVIELTEEERATLERWVRGTSTEQRFVQRARIYRAGSGGGKHDEGCRI